MFLKTCFENKEYIDTNEQINHILTLLYNFGEEYEEVLDYLEKNIPLKIKKDTFRNQKKFDEFKIQRIFASSNKKHKKQQLDNVCLIV